MQTVSHQPFTYPADGRHEPIAVVGMACRLPGADSVSALWELLRAGRDATSRTPSDRYDVDELYAPEPTPGKVISRRSGYLDDPSQFDAAFFGMSAREAKNLDPQQRLLLMTTWEAFEDAGIPPADVAGSRTGVYVGSMHLDYWDLQARRGLENLGPSAIYNYRCVLSGQLSYVFDLRGPSIALDTACSSSLVAVHLACQSLRAGESQLAVAAGVNLKLTPDEDVLLSQVRMLAPDGRCKFGDASANGFAPSDGVGVVILKPLSRALADGDRVRAVILGSAISNDGASSGSLLAPSVEGHTQMLRWAYEDAGVDPADVDFVEAHGTGTPLIDPVEFAGLGEVLGAGREPERPCFVGSVKTNVGHTEGAAGVTALIKTVLCLEHHEVVPSLHFNTPNPNVAWDDLPLVVPTAPTKLPVLDRPVIAGVSGQGISSVNTHLVVGQALPAPQRAEPDTGRTHLLVLSARSPEALEDLVGSYVNYLGPGGDGHELSLRDICFSAARRRQQFEHRLAVAGRTHAELVSALRDRNVVARESAVGDAAAAFVDGRDVDWTAILDPGARYVPLPSYPWRTERYWLEGVSA